ncbi:MAG: hypothetical protein IJ689_01170 [Alphaproteobacteria bacterium]|nr:hypothetical protein [Alphaproteobacteria bacterium]
MVNYKNTRFCDICEISKIKNPQHGVCGDYILQDKYFFNWENFCKEILHKDYRFVCDLIYEQDNTVFIELKTRDWFDEYHDFPTKEVNLYKICHPLEAEQHIKNFIDKARNIILSKIEETMQDYISCGGNPLNPRYWIVFSKKHSHSWPPREELTDSNIIRFIRNRLLPHVPPLICGHNVIIDAKKCDNLEADL